MQIYSHGPITTNMSTKRGRNEDLNVAVAFQKFRKDGAKTKRAQCTHCGYERSWKTDLLRAHLSGCEKYKASLFAKDSAKLQLKQSRITVPALGPIAYKALRLKYAMAVYMGGLMNKFRAQLMPQHVDMLQYIYINERVLNWILRRNATPEELMEVEDKAAEVGEGYIENSTL